MSASDFYRDALAHGAVSETVSVHQARRPAATTSSGYSKPQQIVLEPDDPRHNFAPMMYQMARAFFQKCSNQAGDIMRWISGLFLKVLWCSAKRVVVGFFQVCLTVMKLMHATAHSLDWIPCIGWPLGYLLEFAIVLYCGWSVIGVMMPLFTNLYLTLPTSVQGFLSWAFGLCWSPPPAAAVIDVAKYAQTAIKNANFTDMMGQVQDEVTATFGQIYTDMGIPIPSELPKMVNVTVAGMQLSNVAAGSVMLMSQQAMGLMLQDNMLKSGSPVMNLVVALTLNTTVAMTGAHPDVLGNILTSRGVGDVTTFASPANIEKLEFLEHLCSANLHEFDTGENVDALFSRGPVGFYKKMQIPAGVDWVFDPAARAWYYHLMDECTDAWEDALKEDEGFSHFVMEKSDMFERFVKSLWAWGVEPTVLGPLELNLRRATNVLTYYQERFFGSHHSWLAGAAPLALYIQQLAGINTITPRWVRNPDDPSAIALRDAADYVVNALGNTGRFYALQHNAARPEMARLIQEPLYALKTDIEKQFAEARDSMTKVDKLVLHRMSENWRAVSVGGDEDLLCEYNLAKQADGVTAFLNNKFRVLKTRAMGLLAAVQTGDPAFMCGPEPLIPSLWSQGELVACRRRKASWKNVGTRTRPVMVRVEGGPVEVPMTSSLPLDRVSHALTALKSATTAMVNIFSAVVRKGVFSATSLGELMTREQEAENANAKIGLFYNKNAHRPVETVNVGGVDVTYGGDNPDDEDEIRGDAARLGGARSAAPHAAAFGRPTMSEDMLIRAVLGSGLL